MVYLLFADDLVLFQNLPRDYKTANCPVFICVPVAYHSKHSLNKSSNFNERYTTVSGSFHYDDNIIEKAEQYKYMGVVYKHQVC